MRGWCGGGGASATAPGSPDGLDRRGAPQRARLRRFDGAFRIGVRVVDERRDDVAVVLDHVEEALGGLGYQPPFANSKNLRDTRTGVRIEFLVTGQYPGDGKPKPVSFPDPSEASVELHGIRYVDLQTLLELKLASGMTNPGRLKDLGDIQELIRARNLGPEFASQLNLYVREKFVELASAVQQDKGSESES